VEWRRYSGTIESKKGQKKAIEEALREFSIAGFFVDAGTYLLIDGIYPDVTEELKELLGKLRQRKVKVVAKIQIGAAHIRDISEWAEETYTERYDARAACRNS